MPRIDHFWALLVSKVSERWREKETKLNEVHLRSVKLAKENCHRSNGFNALADSQFRNNQIRIHNIVAVLWGLFSIGNEAYTHLHRYLRGLVYLHCLKDEARGKEERPGTLIF